MKDALKSILNIVKDGPANAILKAVDRVIVDPMERAKIEQELLQLKQNGELEAARIDADDRKSARDMAKAQGVRTQSAITFLLIPAMCAYVGFLTFSEVPKEGRELASDILFYLFGLLSGVMTFWFGSSSGSAHKNDIISQLKGKKDAA